MEELLASSGPLALEQLLPLGLHVASALHYLAGEGVVHLDVKPSNIVMGGPPRLIDLSVARTVAEAAALRSVVGTDAFMAPEQAAPDGRIGPAADVFGLAATLYIGLTGSRPFPGRDRTPVPRLPRRTPRELASRARGRPRLRSLVAPDRARIRVRARAARRRTAAANDPGSARLAPRRIPSPGPTQGTEHPPRTALQSGAIAVAGV